MLPKLFPREEVWSDIAKIIATAEVMGTIKWTGDIMGNIGAGAKLAGDLLANAGDPTAAMTGFGIDKQVKERKEFVEKNYDTLVS